ncbi:MAG TPA: hypothetical protein VGK85_09355 [Myxococcaceae bacterium]|jgi:hypothetical protein
MMNAINYLAEMVAWVQARLARGWTPTATSMVDGEVVLGHAACVVTRGA